MEKILKISIIVVILVAIIYLIVGTFFANDTKANTQYGGFGKMVSSSNANNISTDELEVTIDKILINLSSGQYKYMKSDMSFKMKNEDNKDKLKKSMPYIRDSILRFSATYDSDMLSTDAGKQEYKKNLQTMINDTYGLEIDQIYFRNFVLAK